MIVTGSWDNSAKVWDTQTGQVIRKLEGGHTSFINTATFSPDGQTILTASDDGTAKLWSVETGTVMRSLVGHTIESARPPIPRTVRSSSRPPAI